jgi:hypothetical protein
MSLTALLHPLRERPVRLRAFAVPILLASVIGTNVLASPADLHRELRAAVDRPIPSASSVIGAEPRRAPRGVAIIGNPEGGSDCAATAMGRAMGVVLRVEAWGTTRVLSFEAPMTFWNASNPTSTPDNLTRAQRIGRRIGARWVIDGALSESAGEWNVAWRVADTEPAGTTRAVKTTLRPAQANADLARTLRALLDAMGAQPDDDQAARVEHLANHSNDAFAALVEAFRENCEASGVFAGRVAAAHDRFPTYTALALLRWQDLDIPDRAQRRAELSRILAGAGANPIVGIYLNESLTWTTPRGEGQAELPALRALAARYPHEPYSSHALSNALYAHSALYADAEPGRRAEVVSGPIDHPARFAEAMAVAARAIELWPKDYKSWWMLAEATNHYAQAIRGTCGWDCVPASAKARLPAIWEVFDEMVSEGLRAYPASEPLLAARIMSDQQMGRDWWPNFTLAVRQRPQAYYVYQNAMIYAGDGWGGDAGLRRQVYDLAVQNNPDADWPSTLYADWAPFHETLGVRFGHWFWLGLLLVGAIFGYRWVRSRRSP